MLFHKLLLTILSISVIKSEIAPFKNIKSPIQRVGNAIRSSVRNGPRAILASVRNRLKSSKAATVRFFKPKTLNEISKEVVIDIKDLKFNEKIIPIWESISLKTWNFKDIPLSTIVDENIYDAFKISVTKRDMKSVGVVIPELGQRILKSSNRNLKEIWLKIKTVIEKCYKDNACITSVLLGIPMIWLILDKIAENLNYEFDFNIKTFASSVGKCSIQAAAYGKCMSLAFSDVQQNSCAKEFIQFKNCVLTNFK